jgi:hypothetical protein
MPKDRFSAAIVRCTYGTTGRVLERGRPAPEMMRISHLPGGGRPIGITAGAAGRVGGMGLGYAFASASRLRAAAPSGSVIMSIHFESGVASAP